jgi:hypothetical protein
MARASTLRRTQSATALWRLNKLRMLAVSLERLDPHTRVAPAVVLPKGATRLPPYPSPPMRSRGLVRQHPGGEGGSPAKQRSSTVWQLAGTSSDEVERRTRCGIRVLKLRPPDAGVIS